MVLNLALSPNARRHLAAGMVLTAVLVAVAGCGRRGSLEAPPGATATPRAATPQRMAAPVAQVTTSDFAELDTDPALLVDENPSADRRTRAVPVAPAPVDPNAPRKPFILDSLVN